MTSPVISPAPTKQKFVDRHILESRATHVEPAYLTAKFVVSVIAFMFAAAQAWIRSEVDADLLRNALTGASLVSLAAAAFAGNTYRARDIRTRVWNGVRAAQLDCATAYTLSVPVRTITQRIRVAGAGAAIGGLGLAGVAAYAGADTSSGNPAYMAVGLVLAASTASYVLGTQTRPLD